MFAGEGVDRDGVGYKCVYADVAIEDGVKRLIVLTHNVGRGRTGDRHLFLCVFFSRC